MSHSLLALEICGSKDPAHKKAVSTQENVWNMNFLHRLREMFLPKKSFQCYKSKYWKCCWEEKKKSFLLMNIDKFYSQVWFQARKDKSPFHEALKNWERNTKFTNSFQCSSLFYHHYWKSTGPETFLAWKPIRWHFKIQTWEAISDFIPFFSLIATLSFHCGSQPTAFQPTLQPPTCLFMHTKEHSHVRLLTSHSFLHPGHDWLHIFTSPTQDMQWTLPWASQHSWSPLQILPHICKAMMKWVSVPSHTQTTSSQS